MDLMAGALLRLALQDNNLRESFQDEKNADDSDAACRFKMELGGSRTTAGTPPYCDFDDDDLDDDDLDDDDLDDDDLDDDDLDDDDLDDDELDEITSNATACDTIGYVCPGCGSILEVRASWNDCDAQCAACSKKFIIKL